ncbi:phage shock protein PspA [Psychrosphaera sp. I2R16]|uniref:phage shock protein PspA n=1 Tax=unclassified Psychrosphaera TaxID=2641570 RepID=UPI001C088078|nr:MULTISPECIES: phage shock protein PspA [unclassified Psychrosphaera]MBU2882725.1 phage shock protein PspA [Psychrosphaera sp. I2R16]
MGVITRFVDIVNSNLNSALDSAEKPEKMLRMIIQEMEEALVDIRCQAAQFIAEKKVMERKITKLTSQSTDWQHKAELAVNKEREDLARQALIAKSECENEISEIQAQLNVVETSLAAITNDASSLQTKLSEAKQKQNTLMKREQAAVVQLHTRRQIDSSKLESVSQRYEQLHQKIENLESQVEAYDVTSNPSLEEQFRKLEADSKVETELQELKAKVANG